VPSVVQLIGPPTDPPTNLVSGPTNLTPVNSTLYFEADDGTHGTELWRTAGQPGDAARVEGSTSTPDTGPVYFDPGTAVPEQVQAGNWLYFFTDNGNGTYTLWRNDSTASPSSPSQQVLQNLPADPTGASCIGPGRLPGQQRGPVRGEAAQGKPWSLFARRDRSARSDMIFPKLRHPSKGKDRLHLRYTCASQA
jgi:ELWxxDGT repeat protein